MTENNTPQYGQHSYMTPQPAGYPNTPAPKKKRSKAWILPAGTLALGLVIGGASAASSTPEPVVETKTVEKRVEVPGPERTVTKEVKVPVPTTPAACLEALTLTEEAFDLAAQSMDYISQYQITQANAVTKKLQALTPKVNAAKLECRASQ